MFKLVIAFAIIAVAAARPGYVSSPLYTAVVGEKTIESHGNSVVHSSLPVVQTYAAQASPVVYAGEPLLAEKTVTSYGQSLVHHGGPVYQHAAYVAPTYYL